MCENDKHLHEIWTAFVGGKHYAASFFQSYDKNEKNQFHIANLEFCGFFFSWLVLQHIHLFVGLFNPEIGHFKEFFANNYVVSSN